MGTPNEGGPGDIGESEKSLDNSTYVVQRGDTLAGVALRLGVKQSELKRVNRMYGSKTLVTGQLLKVGAAPKSVVEVAGEVIPPSDLPAGEQATAPQAAPFAVTVAATTTAAAPPPAATPAAPAPVAATPVEVPVAEKPQKDEGDLWFDKNATDVGSFEMADASGLRSEMPQERKEDEVELLYEPPQWGAGPGATSELGSGSRQPSDASSSAAGAVSLRGVIRYMFSPSSTKATGGSFAESSPVGSVAAADKMAGSSPNTSASAVDEGLPSQEAWTSGARERGLSGARERGLSGARERGYSGARERVLSGAGGGGGSSSFLTLPPRSTRDASDASAKSTAKSLLAMVTPRSWRSHDDEVEAEDVKRELDGSGEEDSRSYCSSMEDGTPVALAMATGAGGGEFAPPQAQTVPLKLPGLVAGGSTIVTHSTLARMELALPKHFRGYNWYLLFSTFRDGASYIQLYNRIKAERPTFLIVESMCGEVFGGFATSAWSSGCQYYGTGECFLFTLEGERVKSTETAGAGEGEDGEGRALVDGDIVTHQWTGMNTYLQYSDADGMGMGGGGEEGAFGLFIGDGFLSGSTGTCDTFCNPPLCSKKQFEISQVEVWGFSTADTEMGARLERLRKTLRGKTTRPL